MTRPYEVQCSLNGGVTWRRYCRRSTLAAALDRMAHAHPLNTVRGSTYLWRVLDRRTLTVEGRLG